MAYLINEQKLVEDNAFKFENRLNTQLSRFLDKNPVFVTYYHINSNDSTVNEGFKDVEDIIGDNSPIKYNKIENFPIYGLEQVVLSIQDTDEGLNTDYSGEAIFLPNTVKPLPNDFFELHNVHDRFLFRVTAVEYDNIRPDNYYKIAFKFEYLDTETGKKLDNQVEAKYSCVLQNIGTENNCIIQEDYYEQLQKIDELFNDMVSTYKIIFYNERYNCFLGESDDKIHKLYDPLQTEFFNKHKLLNRKNDLSTIVLNEGFADNKRKIKYEKSIYRFFERRDPNLAKEFGYVTIPGMSKPDSSFGRWHDDTIQIVDISLTDNKTFVKNILPNEIAMSFKLNGPTTSKYIELMQKFIRNETLTIYDIPLDLNEVLLTLDASEEVFFYTPILLYVIQTIVNDFLKEKI